jgi:dephospho-CoA kinase
MKVGLTGNIGTGKSTVARLFAELGVPTFDADHVGHALLESDDEVKSKILEIFGETVMVDHKISRVNLGRIVFADPKKRSRLEQILHPAIAETINERIMDLPSVSYVVVEGALIYEAGLEEDFDYIVLVKADRKIAVDRAAANLGLEKIEIVKRLNAQLTQSAKEELADFVVANNGTVEELRHKVTLLHSVFLSLSKRPISS